jgi:hypothetical protein
MNGLRWIMRPIELPSTFSKRRVSEAAASREAVMTHSVLQDVLGDVSTMRDERGYEAQFTFDRLLREYFRITPDCQSSRGNWLETPQFLHMTDAEAVPGPGLSIAVV